MLELLSAVQVLRPSSELLKLVIASADQFPQPGPEDGSMFLSPSATFTNGGPLFLFSRPA